MRTRHLRHTLGWSLLGASSLLPAGSSCARESTDQRAADSVETANARTEQRVNPRLRQATHAQQLSQAIPSYGGHYFDAAGIVHVYLANPADSQRAKRILAPLAEGYERFRPLDRRTPSVAIHHGAYTYSQLASWVEMAIHRVSGMAGVSGIGIDVRYNAVAIGVTHAAAGPAVADSLTKLGVPRAAIRIETRGPAVDLSAHGGAEMARPSRSTDTRTGDPSRRAYPFRYAHQSAG